MSTSPIIVTRPAPSVEIEPGHEGRLSFTIESLAAPGELHEVTLEASWVGEDGQSRVVDWLVAEPRALRIAGGTAETVTVTVSPSATGQRGRTTIALAIADRERPDDVYARSTVVCEVGAPRELASPAVARTMARAAPRSRSWWAIPAVAGALLLAGGGAFLGWKLACNEARPLIAHLPSGDPCDRDPTTKACVESTSDRCGTGPRRCTPDGTGLRSCGDDGRWKTEPCPAGAPRCRDGTCQCAANRGKACNCGGTVQCSGACSTAPCTGGCVNGRCCVFRTAPGCGSGGPPARAPDFNFYVLKALDQLYQNRRGKGYNINSAYTQDLDYSQPGEIKAGAGAPATMCVAAVSEVIIAALKLYADAHGDRSVFDKLPARSWMKGAATDIRPYMFLYESVDSSGTADALKHFGLGEHRPFPALVPGDFIGFNRESGSGHAVIFLGFLNASGQIEPVYDSRKVVGFKYFSAQGKAPPSAGLGYRWAFFGKCPSWREADKPRDCGIIASDDQKLFNTGYMLHPTRWVATPAMRMLKTRWTQKYSVEILSRRLGRTPTRRDMLLLPRAELRRLEDQARRELSRELPPVSRLAFDGATADD